MKNKEDALQRLTAIENEAKELRKIINCSTSKHYTDFKTLEDACNDQGVDPKDFDRCITKINGLSERDMVSIRGYAKNIVIYRTIRQTWKPDWANMSQYKYRLWVEMNKSGVGFSYSTYDGTNSHSHVGARLLLQDSERILYIAKQFPNEIEEYICE